MTILDHPSSVPNQTRPNGSNFRTWIRDLEELAFDVLHDKFFFNKTNNRPRLERLARNLLIQSFHRSLRPDFYNFSSSFDIMESIKSRLNIPSRQAQTDQWDSLSQFTIDEDTCAASIASSIRNGMDDLEEFGVEITRDNIMSLILHSCLKNGPLKAEFGQRVDARLIHRSEPIKFDTMISILSATILHQKSLGVKSVTPSANFPSQAFHTTPQFEEVPPSPARQDLVISHPDNIYVLASRPAYQKCFRCGSTEHLISQCTAPPALPVSNTHRAWNPPNHPTPVRQHNPPPARHDHYRPHPDRQQAMRPNYAPQQPCARFVEPLPSDRHFNNLELNTEPLPDDQAQEAIFDTGATHHMTGDNSGESPFSWSQFDNSGTY